MKSSKDKKPFEPLELENIPKAKTQFANDGFKRKAKPSKGEKDALQKR